MILTRDGLGEYARQFVAELPCSRGSRAHVVGLSGELGSGKTTFVQMIARELGVSGDVTSPTYVLMQRYPISNHPTFKSLIHIDAYRLAPEEPDTIGFAAALADPTNLIMVEWPENLVPQCSPSVTLSFGTVNENTRRIINI